MKKPLNLDSDFGSSDSDKTIETWNIGRLSVLWKAWRKFHLGRQEGKKEKAKKANVKLDEEKKG